MTKTPFQHYVASARRRPQLWRLVAGALIVLACSMLWIGVGLGSVWLFAGPERALELGQKLQAADTPRATLLLLATFAGMALGPILAVRLLHRRSGASLFGPRGRVVRDFGRAAGVVLAVYGVGICLWLLMFDPVVNLDSGRWALLLPLAFIGVAVQTGAEEMVFRGYLMQQLAARFDLRLIWWVVPALIFGAVHYDPATAGSNAWIIVGSAVVFGLAAGDLTARTGSLGAAWGFHFANNVVAILVVATQGTITGLSLWLTPYGVDDTGVMRMLVLGDLAMLLISWAVLRMMLRA